MGYKKILCVDFDGVIHSYDSGWQGVDVVGDGPVPGAINFLLDATLKFDVQIYSSRSKDPKGVIAMKKALAKWCEPEFEGLVDIDEFLSSLKFPTQKPAAWLTIDDRAVCFKGEFLTMKQIEDFKPWNKA